MRPKSPRIKIIIKVILLMLPVLVLVAGFTLLSAKMTRAKKVSALHMAISIESAAHEFYTEYGVVPKAPAEVKTDDPDGVELITVLKGEEKSATPQNLRAIKFLFVKQNRIRKNLSASRLSESSVVGLYDPWGNPYTVVTDQDGDGQLQFKYGSITKTLEGRRVVAYSPGEDGKTGTKDDVTPW